MSLAGIINSHLICAKLILNSALRSKNRDGCLLWRLGAADARCPNPIVDPTPVLLGVKLRDGDEWRSTAPNVGNNGEKAGVVALLAASPRG